MLGWKVAAMVLIVFGVLLANARAFGIRSRMRTFLKWYGVDTANNLFYAVIPLAIAGYCVYSLGHRWTALDAWLRSPGWYKILLAELGWFAVLQVLNPFEQTWKLLREKKPRAAWGSLAVAELLYAGVASAVVFGAGAHSAIQVLALLAGGQLLSIAALALAKASQWAFRTDEAILAAAVVLVAISSAIQIFILSPG